LHIPSLNWCSKNNLLAASGFNASTLSYIINLHMTNEQAIQNQLINYKYAILLFKLYNQTEQSSA
jgi:hypothetical protein